MTRQEMIIWLVKYYAAQTEATNNLYWIGKTYDTKKERIQAITDYYDKAPMREIIADYDQFQC